MSQTPDWLQRLNVATEYTELQEIFGQLAAHAESSPNDPQLVSTIDDAIQRLVGERARDERERNEVQTRYDSFKEDNRGVVGWFKRHIPFTATRREELEHQGELADQTAEILADNLVIARAQMIKERLLPADRRQLGQRVAYWQTQWEVQKAQAPAAGRLLVQLRAEMVRSRAFVEELQRDIEAFAGAEFREVTDRQRRDTDLVAARRELDALNQEISSERAIEQSGLKLLIGKVAAELTATDAEFRRDGQQMEQLGVAFSRLEELHAMLTKLVATVGQVGGLRKQLQSWPDQLQQARQALARIEAERVSAEQVRGARTQLLQERQLRLAEAQRAVNQAAQMLTSLQSAYDAHLAQRVASFSMPQAVEVEPPSPIEQQHQSARGAVDQAQSQLQEITASVEAARREVTQAESAVKAAADKLALEQQKLSDLEKKEPKIRSELSGHSDRGQREFAAAAGALAAYLHIDRAAIRLPPYHPDEVAAGTIGYLGLRGMEPNFGNALFHSGPDLTRHLQAATTLDRLNQWQDIQRRAVEQERAQTRTRRETTWKRRCRELLGDILAEEACSRGLTE